MGHPCAGQLKESLKPELTEEEVRKLKEEAEKELKQTETKDG